MRTKTLLIFKKLSFDVVGDENKAYARMDCTINKGEELKDEGTFFDFCPTLIALPTSCFIFQLFFLIPTSCLILYINEYFISNFKLVEQGKLTNDFMIII